MVIGNANNNSEWKYNNIFLTEKIILEKIILFKGIYSKEVAKDVQNIYLFQK